MPIRRSRDLRSRGGRPQKRSFATAEESFAKFTNLSAGEFTLRCSYRPAFLSALQTLVPPLDRFFEPQNKTWFIAIQWRQQLEDLALRHFKRVDSDGKILLPTVNPSKYLPETIAAVASFVELLRFIPPSQRAEALKSIYHAALLIWHPDLYKSEDLRDTAHETTIKIQELWKKIQAQIENI